MRGPDRSIPEPWETTSKGMARRKRGRFWFEAVDWNAVVVFCVFFVVPVTAIVCGMSCEEPAARVRVEVRTE